MIANFPTTKFSVFSRLETLSLDEFDEPKDQSEELERMDEILDKIQSFRIEKPEVEHTETSNDVLTELLGSSESPKPAEKRKIFKKIRPKSPEVDHFDAGNSGEVIESPEIEQLTEMAESPEPPDRELEELLKVGF